MFLISPRNVPAAVVDMLRRTGCRHVFVSQDDPIQNLMAVAMPELQDVTLHPMLTFEEIFPPSAPVDGTVEPEDLPKEYDMNGTAMILHSSGTS